MNDDVKLFHISLNIDLVLVSYNNDYDINNFLQSHFNLDGTTHYYWKKDIDTKEDVACIDGWSLDDYPFIASVKLVENYNKPIGTILNHDTH